MVDYHVAISDVTPRNMVVGRQFNVSRLEIFMSGRRISNAHNAASSSIVARRAPRQ